MKSQLKIASVFAAVLLAANSLFAHGGVELGPNGGRILEFSKDETMHGEVTAKDGKFHIALLDKDMKPVALAEQTLTVTAGDRDKPTKVEVTKADGKFVVPMQKGEAYWVIFQFKASAKAKPVTARLHYNAEICEECKAAEWLCKCAPEGETKEKKK
ncbi:hypothetical protein [Verrucomicrobium sp. BvORR106]|uniref:hypothetical protein n=1 Tax=Verrucomicrobium sp. BvORR106 TaxID=1403819 RepID=UPI00056FB4A1|nr:hypothetical protein [Verrucomicrobium sp. BvORR106]